MKFIASRNLLPYNSQDGGSPLSQGPVGGGRLLEAPHSKKQEDPESRGEEGEEERRVDRGEGRKRKRENKTQYFIIAAIPFTWVGH